MSSDSDNYRKMLEDYDRLEDSGALEEGAEGMTGTHEESTLDRFMNNPKNKTFLPSHLQKTKSSEKKTKPAPQLQEKTINIDWDLVESLYELGVKRGYIKIKE